MQVMESISSLLLGLWMLTGVTLSDGSSQALSFCQKKNFYQFNADGTFESKKHFQKGIECASFPVKGKYKLSDDENQIYLFLEGGEKDKLTIGLVNVNEQTLKLKIKGDLVQLTKAGSSAPIASPSASSNPGSELPRKMYGKWFMIKSSREEGGLSECQKKSFIQLNTDGTAVMGNSKIKDGNCVSESSKVNYHVTMDLKFMVIEIPERQKTDVMKIVSLDEDKLILGEGRHTYTFAKK